MEGAQELLHPDFNIPWEIIDAILVCLPIKDAARTSVLSSRWSSRWQNMSKLRFDVSCLPPPSANETRDHRLNKLVRIVDSVLTLHVGAIQRFELAADLPCCPDVNRWINFLSRHHIKEITLRFAGGEPYRVPSHLFASCEGLTHLELCHCVLSWKGSFAKLSNLEFLVLKKVVDRFGRLEDLISSCTNLKFLSLGEIIGSYKHMKIHAPNLQEICINHISCNLSVDDALPVTKATFIINKACDKKLLNLEESIKIAKILVCFPNLEELQLKSYSLQWLFADDYSSNVLPLDYHRLKRLYMVIDFLEKEEFMDASFMLRSSPNLQVLLIEGVSNITITCSWEPEDLNVTFDQLRVIKMANLLGTPQELWLIKCILAKAPVLRSITISMTPKKRNTDNSQIFLKLMRYRRASPLAEIIFAEHDLVLT